MVLCAANSEIAPTSRLARNTKYLYQDSTFSTTPKSPSLDQERDIQRAVAVENLSLVPQHDAFAAGKMPVVLFNLDNLDDNTAHSKQEAEKTICSLTTHQRPTLIFLPSPEQTSIKEIGVDPLATKMELDNLEGFPLAVDLDTHYFLNLKAALCNSGLPRYVVVLRIVTGLSPLGPMSTFQMSSTSTQNDVTDLGVIFQSKICTTGVRQHERRS